MKNILTLITSTLPNPNGGNMGIALRPVFHIFFFMLQNPRNIDKVLESLRNYLMGVKKSIIFVFEYINTRVSPANRCTLIGILLAGCISLIAFLLQLWAWTTCFVACLLGGFIGSTIYKIKEMSWDELDRTSEVW